MNIQDLAGKKVVLIGYGKEGQATESFLKKQLPEVDLTIRDASQGEQYLDGQRNFDLAIKSPGIPKELIKIPYITATQIFFSTVPKTQIIGVTGTKGKSTTTSLIHHILMQAGHDARLVGNIGNPMLEELAKPYDEKTIFVCELSSYQLQELEQSPHIGVIVSLFPDHINYHGSLESYYASKKCLIQNMNRDDIYIYNPKFSLLSDWEADTQATSIPYEQIKQFPQMPLLGEHNKDNVRAAITVAHQYGISDDLIHQAIATFKPLPHRLELVGTYREITFYDDAISTTPESTIAALKAIPNVKTIMLGGQDRGYIFEEFVEYLKTTQIESMIFFPDSGARIRTLVEETFDHLPAMLSTDNMKDAVAFAYEHTPAGGVCLLSTASPSYSIWKNFEDKGAQFQEYVKHYAQQDPQNTATRKEEV
ncbi:MAG: UDP-N-acetylmuramoyl-L-alanine--D-glutamate ligase [Weeksellaceae bacterium]